MLYSPDPVRLRTVRNVPSFGISGGVILAAIYAIREIVIWVVCLHGTTGADRTAAIRALAQRFQPRWRRDPKST